MDFVIFTLTDIRQCYSLCMFCRLKAAEESFRQAKEKASYSVKPKHASGIVSWPLPFRSPKWQQKWEFHTMENYPVVVTSQAPSWVVDVHWPSSSCPLAAPKQQGNQHRVIAYFHLSHVINYMFLSTSHPHGNAGSGCTNSISFLMSARTNVLRKTQAENVSVNFFLLSQCQFLCKVLESSTNADWNAKQSSQGM